VYRRSVGGDEGQGNGRFFSGVDQRFRIDIDAYLGVERIEDALGAFLCDAVILVALGARDNLFVHSKLVGQVALA